MLKSFKSRIIALLVLANLPAAVLAVVAGLWSYGDSRDLQRVNVQQAANVLAARTAEILGIARSTIATMSLDEGLVASPDGCRLRLDAIVANVPSYVGAFLSRQDGSLICSSGTFPENTQARSTLFQAISAAEVRNPVTFLAEASGGDNKRVIGGRRVPLPGGGNALLAIAIDQSAFETLFGETLPRPRAGAIMTASGQVLATDTANGEAHWLPAPADWERETARQGFTATSYDDKRRFYSAVSIPETSAYVLVSRPERVMALQDNWQLITIIGVPLVTILLTTFVILFGLDHLMLAWIRRLRVAAFDYAAGHYDTRVEKLEEAPTEVADLGDAFNTMANAVTDRSDALEGAVADKDRILRELHHRVKNNFQMIASLLALQRRELPADMRHLLRVPEDRVLAMAAAHKASYATGEIGHVEVFDLLSDVAVQIRQSFGARAPKIVVETDKPEAQRIAVDLDRAVPLALLVSELISAGLSHAGEDIRISISHAVGGEGFDVSVTGRGISDALPRTALPGRLVTAYVSQLHAKLDSDTADVLRLKVPGPVLGEHAMPA